MRYIKKTIDSLEKCYSLAPLTVNGEPRLLVAAEKQDPCYLYALDGTSLETVWDEPGGVMTMAAVPGMDGTFLATQKFYSPNDSAEAYLTCVQRTETGWQRTRIAALPFVHRFDIIPVNGVNYVLACTLKSDHEYKNDWRFPGKLWVGVLDSDPAKPLELTVLKDGLTHNHGYTRYEKAGTISGIVSCDEGVYRVTPPADVGGEWQIERLLQQATSDAVLIDLDGDGEAELLTMSAFHGDTVRIWHKSADGYQCVYEHPKKLPFLHAIYAGEVYGRRSVYIGHREGERLFLGFYYDAASGAYRYGAVDQGAGAANCLLFERDGHPAILAANREINEVAIYDIEQ